MRNKVIILSLVGVFCLSLAPQVSAQDVYVDMSVLDSLSGDDVVVYSQPMFPVVAGKPKKTTPKAKIMPKAKPAPKTKVAKVVAAPKVEKAKKTVALPADSIFKAAPAEVKDTVSAAPVAKVASEVEMNNPQAAPLVDLSEKKVESYDSSSDWVEVVDVEPVSVPVAETPAMPAAPVVLAAPVIPAEVVSGNIATSTPITSEPVVVQAPAAPTLLVEPAVVAPTLTSSQITYVESISELNPEQQAQIDKIIAGFENAHVNKIAIFSFNLDDGKDVFKKKRLSLNRAVEVRSYLLQKGYKNFSIKVINVDESSDKINKVEIQELK